MDTSSFQLSNSYQYSQHKLRKRSRFIKVFHHAKKRENCLVRKEIVHNLIKRVGQKKRAWDGRPLTFAIKCFTSRSDERLSADHDDGKGKQRLSQIRIALVRSGNNFQGQRLAEYDVGMR